MGRPSKPVQMLRLEGSSHRTKAELEAREKQENALLTGESLAMSKAVSENPDARAIFLRIRKLLRKIGKADALFEHSINRYALIAAECADFERKREVFHERALALDQAFDAQDEDTPEKERIRQADYFRLSAQLQGQVVALDKQVQAKRRMMLDIEKESVMTISSALRAIPKAPPDEDSADDPMTQMLRRRYGTG